MTIQRIAKIMLALGVCIALAFGYVALQHRSKPAPEKENEAAQSPVVSDAEKTAEKTAKQNDPEPISDAEGKPEQAGEKIVKTVQTSSSNPLFADGVPEHLHCPEEWVGVYVNTLSQSDHEELGRIGQLRIDEILSKYNPRRPLTEVWPLYIAAEKYYFANADSEHSGPGEASGRLDWQYQNMLDFPEIFVLGNTDVSEQLRDRHHYSTMREVAKGRWDPDLNVHILQDGREFRARDGYRYEEIASKTGSDAKWGTKRTIGFGHSGKDAELVKIYLSDTSDEELEQLGGWNYNIDPYATGIYTLPEDAAERVLERIRSAYGGLKK